MAFRALSRSLLLASRGCQQATTCGFHFSHLLNQSDDKQSSQSNQSKLPSKLLTHHTHPFALSPFLRSQWSASSRERVQEQILELLQSTNVLRLRQDLEDQASTKFHIPYSQLIQMCQSSGAASSRQEAEQLARALIQTGVVLKFGDIVYLRPQEIAELIIHTLPGTSDETKRKLQEVELELEGLNQKHQAIEAEARKWPNFFLYGGCALLSIQLIAFARLTFVELSWDVMEPIAYLISLFYTLVGYIYFLAFRSGYDFGDFEEYWKSRNKERKCKEVNFDPRRHQYLLKLQDRYKQHLAAISNAEPSLKA